LGPEQTPRLTFYTSNAGVILPLLQQSVMFFNIAFSKLVLRKQLAWQQYLGAAAVVAGVCIAALPADGGTSIFAGVRVTMWTLSAWWRRGRNCGPGHPVAPRQLVARPHAWQPCSGQSLEATHVPVWPLSAKLPPHVQPPLIVSLCARLQVPLKYVAIFVVSMMFPALDSITKEKVRSHLKPGLFQSLRWRQIAACD
jgi:hypothetical protein